MTVRKSRSTRWMFDVQRKDGKIGTMSVFADSAAEADENARFVAHLVGALYLANLTKHDTCLL